MRSNWAVILTAMVLPCGSVWSAQKAQPRVPPLIPAGTVVTLPEAISLALKNQPSVRQAEAQVEFQTGGVTQARSTLLPDTSVNSSTAIAASEGNTGTSVTLSGSQLLFDFNRSRSLLTEAERLRAADVAALEATTEDVVFDVKQAYYAALRTNRLVSVFQENLKAQDEHVAQAQARLDAGLAPKSDVLKAAAAAASARVDLVAAKNNAAQALVVLNIAMGVDVRSDTKLEETQEPEAPVPTLDDAVEMALRNRPEMRQAEDQVAAALAALKSAKTGNLPAFTTSVANFSDFGGPFGSSNSWEWLVNLQWTPFDSGFTRGAVTEASAQLTQADEALYTVRQTVSQDVVVARLNIIAALEALTAADAEVASARESLDAAVGRYEAGIGIFLDVLDSQAALLKAQVDQAVARYGLSTARAQLERAVGATVASGIYATTVGGICR